MAKEAKEVVKVLLQKYFTPLRRVNPQKKSGKTLIGMWLNLTVVLHLKTNFTTFFIHWFGNK